MNKESKLMGYKIYNFNPSQDDVIVWKYDSNSLNLDDAYKMHKKLQLEFPNNKVIFMPNYISLETCDKKDFIEWLKKYLEE